MSIATPETPTAPTMPSTVAPDSLPDTGFDSGLRTVSQHDEGATDDPNILTHIVKVPDNKKDTTTPEAWVNEARIFGTPVEALCGFTWVPSRDPKKYKICEKCLQRYNLSLKNPGDRKHLPGF